MQRLFLLLPVLVLLSLCLGCQNQTQSDHLSDPVPAKDSTPVVDEPNPIRIIGFYLGDGQDLEKYDLRKLTHVVFCFTRLEGHTVGFRKAENKETLKRLCALKADYPKLKVIVSFGGWGGCYSCSKVFARETYRQRFAESVRDLLIEYNADGFDLDWESPVIGGTPNQTASEDDKANFTKLVRALRKELPAVMELSFDANTFPAYVAQSVEWDSVMPLVDYVNLMTYSMPGNDPTRAGHHTALHSSPAQRESVELAIRRFDSLGVPRRKLVIGAAFYGEMVETADPLNHGLGRSATFKAHINYQRIAKELLTDSKYTYHWDSVSKAPFLFNTVNRTFTTFDDRKSVALKTKYAVDQQLGGIMFWKLNADTYENGLLDAIYEASGNGETDQTIK